MSLSPEPKRSFAVLALVLAAAAIPALLVAVTVTMPHTFADGQVASATQVNQNFDSLKTAIETNVAGYTGTLKIAGGSYSGSYGLDVTSGSMTHFIDFTQASPPGTSSPTGHYISDDDNASYGWHHSPATFFPSHAGIDFGPGTAKVIRRVSFDIHSNPFKDFILQASNDSTTGLNGTWTDLVAGTIVGRTDHLIEAFTFNNTKAYRWYRVKVLSGYASGWAMFEWKLQEENLATTTLTLENGLIKSVSP